MENPKLDLAPSMDGRGPEEKIISTQKISVSDHINGFQYSTDNKSDSFVIDMESFSHGGTNKETNPNSRITRSLSRKGSQRGDKKIITPSSNSSSTVNDRDSFVAATSSPIGCGTPEKPTAVAVGSTMEHGSSNPQLHQITITTGSNISSASESRFGLRRSGSRRSPPPWQLDPKRILLFFATLSSLGTILLIYFTLSISKMNKDGSALD